MGSHALFGSLSMLLGTYTHIATHKKKATTATANSIHKATIIILCLSFGHLHPLHHLLPMGVVSIYVFVRYFCGFQNIYFCSFFSSIFDIFFFIFFLLFVCWCICAPVLWHCILNSCILWLSFVSARFFSSLLPSLPPSVSLFHLWLSFYSFILPDQSNHICARSSIPHVNKRMIHWVELFFPLFLIRSLIIDLGCMFLFLYTYYRWKISA